MWPQIPVAIEPPPIDETERKVVIYVASYIAALFEFELKEVYNTIAELPDEAIGFLTTPQGWKILADYTAHTLTGG